MCRENPGRGAPRIHGELLKLGIDIGETSVSRYYGAVPEAFFSDLAHLPGEPRLAARLRRFLHGPHNSFPSSLRVSGFGP
jgi:hypothetical protein